MDVILISFIINGKALSFLQLFSSIHVSRAQPPGRAETSSGLYQHIAALALFYLAEPREIRESARISQQAAGASLLRH